MHPGLLPRTVGTGPHGPDVGRTSDQPGRGTDRPTPRGARTVKLRPGRLAASTGDITSSSKVSHSSGALTSPRSSSANASTRPVRPEAGVVLCARARHRLGPSSPPTHGVGQGEGNNALYIKVDITARSSSSRTRTTDASADTAGTGTTTGWRKGSPDDGRATAWTQQVLLPITRQIAGIPFAAVDVDVQPVEGCAARSHRAGHRDLLGRISNSPTLRALSAAPGSAMDANLHRASSA